VRFLPYDLLLFKDNDKKELDFAKESYKRQNWIENSILRLYIALTYIQINLITIKMNLTSSAHLEETSRSEERVKPFRLVKYFTFSSIIVMFIGAIIISVLNIHWAREMQQEKSEEYAHVLIENLNHQIFFQFIFPIVLKYGKTRLRDKAQLERMDKLVKSTLHSFKVDLVNIYDMNDTISYSFDELMIGRKNAGGVGYLKALKGKSSSRMVKSGSFFEILFGFPKKIKMITFAPIRAEKPLSTLLGPVLGVLEIVQDLSEDYKSIFRFQIYVIITCSVVMGTLFLVLLFVVNRGEKIISQRTMERIRLKEQLNRAEHLSHIGEMVAAISHEIRNPLGIIKSSAELLIKKTGASGPSTAIPNIINQEASRLNKLITDFLNFAKPIHPNMNLCQVDEIIEKNIAFLSTQIKTNGCTITKHYQDNLPEIMGDFDVLYQAFLNILINSMQAMTQGGIIDIEISSKNGWVCICIADEGHGIPDGLEDKIWDPFFTTKEKGTGLGLGIIKNIIQSHGGLIRIENRKQKGARVIVRLPGQNAG
jgi:two-component system sensor histidine kinase HydH